jgi:prepilin-type N-terminal cleavage/methylation domain-containing protein
VKRRPFTLIEVLAVIAIIAILAAMLLPALSCGKDRARMTYCIKTMHNISAGMMMSADDNDGSPPWMTFSGPLGDVWAYPCDEYVGGQWRELPSDTSWYGNFRSKGSPVWWDCPSFGENPLKNIRAMNYGQLMWQWTDLPRRATAFEQPSEAARLTEANHEVGWSNLGNPWIPVNNEDPYNNCTGFVGVNPVRHSYTYNIGFIDGHIENYHWQTRTTVENSIASWTKT